MRRSFLFIGIVVFVANSLFAQQNAFEFLRLDMSPRAAALAGGFVSGNDDPNVIFYNPSGIAMLEGKPVSFSFLKHLEDINSASVAYSQEFEGIGRFGAGIHYVNYGTFTKADEAGNQFGEFSANEMALSIGYANELDSNFYYGANAKFIFSGIESYTSTALALDLGLHYTIPESKWNFGISVLNLGAQMSKYSTVKEDLPLDVRVGFSKELEHLPFRFFVSLNKLNKDYDNFGERFKQFTLGGEIRLSKVMKLRLGYDNEKRRDLKIGTSAGLAGFNIGLGILVADYKFDYAFSSMGSIGSLHRIGISTAF